MINPYIFPPLTHPRVLQDPITFDKLPPEQTVSATCHRLLQSDATPGPQLIRLVLQVNKDHPTIALFSTFGARWVGFWKQKRDSTAATPAQETSETMSNLCLPENSWIIGTKSGDKAEFTSAAPETDPSFLGASVGRICNRISPAVIPGHKSLLGGAVGDSEGEVHDVLQMAPKFVCLHGGKLGAGFDSRIWTLESVDPVNPTECLSVFSTIPDASQLCGIRIQLSLMSDHDEQGFPGQVKVSAFFYLLASLNKQSRNNGSFVFIDYISEAITQDTPVNVVNHVYFNLHHGNTNTTSVLDHSFRTSADRFLEVDRRSVPTGKLLSIKQHHEMDFTQPEGRTFSSREIPPPYSLNNEEPSGFDHYYVLPDTEIAEPPTDENFEENKAYWDQTNEKILKWVAELAYHDPKYKEKRSVNVYSNQAGFQLYTGNWLQGTYSLERHSGVCIETAGLINAVWNPNFPGIWLKKGNRIHQSALFKFNVE